MSDSSFRSSIMTGFTRLEDTGLTGWDRFLNKVGLEDIEDFRRIASRYDARYPEVYRAGLRYRAYNFILIDRSYFQFTEPNFRDGGAYSCSYYPNPFLMEQEFEDAVKEFSDVGEVEDSLEYFDQLLDEASVDFRRAPLRFDYAPGDYSLLRHPAGHFHIGRVNGSRIPVEPKLSPAAFTLFVAKHYYPDYWDSESQESSDGCAEGENRMDRTLREEHRKARQEIQEELTEIEKMQPFLA